MSGFCCEMMAFNATSTCEHHPDRYDCPDALVSQVRGGYGLIIHDGTPSVIEIAFCPWCGVQLPAIEPADLDAMEPD
jgi:hypothetical protein